MSTAGQAIGGAIGAVVGFLSVAHPARCTARKSVSVSVAASIRQRPHLEGPAPLKPLRPDQHLAPSSPSLGTIALNGNVFWLETTPSGGGVDKKTRLAAKAAPKSIPRPTAYYATQRGRPLRGPFRNPSESGAGSRLDLMPAATTSGNGHVPATRPRLGMTIYKRRESQDTGYAHAGDAWRREHADLPGSGSHRLPRLRSSQLWQQPDGRAHQGRGHDAARDDAVGHDPVASHGRFVRPPGGDPGRRDRPAGRKPRLGLRGAQREWRGLDKTAFTSTRSRYGIAAADNGTVIALRSNEGSMSRSTTARPGPNTKRFTPGARYSVFTVQL